MQATMVLYFLKMCPKCRGDLTLGDAEDELRCVQCGGICYKNQPEPMIKSDSKLQDIWVADQSFLNFHRTILLLFQDNKTAEEVSKIMNKNKDWVRRLLNRFNQIKEYRDVGF